MGSNSTNKKRGGAAASAKKKPSSRNGKSNKKQQQQQEEQEEQKEQQQQKKPKQKRSQQQQKQPTPRIGFVPIAAAGLSAFAILLLLFLVRSQQGREAEAESAERVGDFDVDGISRKEIENLEGRESRVEGPPGHSSSSSSSRPRDHDHGNHLQESEAIVDVEDHRRIEEGQHDSDYHQPSCQWFHYTNGAPLGGRDLTESDLSTAVCIPHDTHLQPMTIPFDVDGDHEGDENDDDHDDDHDDNNATKTVMVYVPPDVSTFYQKAPGTLEPKQLSFLGMFGKFVNMAPFPIKVYWFSGHQKDHLYISHVAPFSSAGTATHPGHRFFVTRADENVVPKDPRDGLHGWRISSKTSIHVYDAFRSGHANISDLKPQELEEYELQKTNLEFGKLYHQKTGVEWLSLYPRRHPPLHPFWPADYFGQEHTVSTRQTQFVSLPPPELLSMPRFDQRDEQSYSRVLLEEYRDGGNNDDDDNHDASGGGGSNRSPPATLNMTLKVISCSPRVFEIRNFLSPAEVDHILEVAAGVTLHTSTTKASTGVGEARAADTRTSKNAWIARSRSIIIDSIYRRAADLLRVDEKLMRNRSSEEQRQMFSRPSTSPSTAETEGQGGDDHFFMDDIPPVAAKQSMAEHLQLVHYDVTQQYTPHHDFALPTNAEGQPMRFATILFYLNDEGLEGGETSFPRWLNAEDPTELKVKPETGKAILFYNLLPDGNMDERSQHSAKPVMKGEKWLINLWFWDPFRRHT